MISEYIRNINVITCCIVEHFSNLKEGRGEFLPGLRVLLDTSFHPARSLCTTVQVQVPGNSETTDPVSLQSWVHSTYDNDPFFFVCRIVEHLGSGQFGTVNKGMWQSPGGAVEVAVKTLKSGSMEEDRVKFLQEAAIMGQFKHPNVVMLHGVVTIGEPLSILSASYFHVSGSW